MTATDRVARPFCAGGTIATIVIGLSAAAAIVLGAAIVLVVETVADGPYLRLLHAAGHVQAGFEHFGPHGWRANILTFMAAAVAAPMAEELLFRGVIFNALTIGLVSDRRVHRFAVRLGRASLKSISRVKPVA